MKINKSSYAKPLSGLGTVSLAKRTFEVTLDYKDEGVEKTKSFSFDNDQLPDNVNFSLKNNGVYFFNIRADGSAINEIRPSKGMFKVKCSGLCRNEDGEFVTIARSGAFGKYTQIIALLEVISGKYAGVVFPMYLTDSSENRKTGKLISRFVKNDEGYLDLQGNLEKSRAFQELVAFLECSGVLDVQIRYPKSGEWQDLLALLDKAILKADKSFFLTVKNGYIETLSDAVEEDDEEDDAPQPKSKKSAPVEDDDEDEDEVPQPKAKAKKSAPVVEDDDDDEEDEDDEDETPVQVKRSAKSKFDQLED